MVDKEYRNMPIDEMEAYGLIEGEYTIYEQCENIIEEYIKDISWDDLPLDRQHSAILRFGTLSEFKEWLKKKVKEKKIKNDL
jgi:hypothetical protein